MVAFIRLQKQNKITENIIRAAVAMGSSPELF
jgi:hypothetical protein